MNEFTKALLRLTKKCDHGIREDDGVDTTRAELVNTTRLSTNWKAASPNELRD